MIKWFEELKEKKWLFKKPWLILGKGPSFEKIKEIPLENYTILSLNHAGEVVGSSITLFIDIDVFSKKICLASTYILAPQHPHINFRPAVGTLFELIQPHNKIYQFRLSTYKKYDLKYDQPIISARYFCAEAAFDIIGYLGVDEVYSLGLDGGQEYAPTFSHLKPLQNRQRTFDVQFKEIKKICRKHEIIWTKL